MPAVDASGALRRRFRPRFVPTLIALPMFLALVGLGVWQLARLDEKSDINAFRAARALAPAEALATDPADPTQYEFRKVSVRGVFRHDRELYMNARSRRGNSGYQVITPLIRDGAPPVLVSRGWVPYERKDPARRAEGQVAGPVTVEGILRTEARRGWLMPDNDATRNEWFWFDLPAMGRAAGVPDVAPYYIDAGPAPNPGGFPIGGQTIVELPNPHLEYAITWLALAAALAGVYIAWHLKAETRA